MARILCSDPGRRGKGLSALAETPHRHQNRGGAPLSTQQPTASEGTVQAQSYDAIVVGSGISGGWAAKERTEQGLRVPLLERGTTGGHIKGSVNASEAPWQ